MYLLDTIGELPFARYEREQDKQDQNRHFQLLWSMLCLLLLCLTREVPKLTHRKKETSLHDKYFHNMIYFSFIYSSILLQKFINIHSKDMVTSQQQWKAETNHVYFKNPQPHRASLTVYNKCSKARWPVLNALKWRWRSSI